MPRSINATSMPIDETIISMILDGRCDKEIATSLDKSVKTIKDRCGRIYKIHGVSSRLQLAVKLYKQQIELLTKEQNDAKVL